MEDEPPQLLLAFKVRRSDALEEARRRSFPRDIAKEMFPFSISFSQAPNSESKVCPGKTKSKTTHIHKLEQIQWIGNNRKTHSSPLFIQMKYFGWDGIRSCLTFMVSITLLKLGKENSTLKSSLHHTTSIYNFRWPLVPDKCSPQLMPRWAFLNLPHVLLISFMILDLPLFWTILTLIFLIQALANKILLHF